VVMRFEFGIYMLVVGGGLGVAVVAEGKNSV